MSDFEIRGANTGGGSGDVVGPASATDNALVRYDLTTGKLIQNSTITVGDTGAFSSTIANTSNVVGMTLTQNDTTNNPRAFNIVNASTASGIFIDQNGNTGANNGTSGALVIDNTDNTGMGLQIYSNQGSAIGLGSLLYVKADNASYAQPLVYLVQDGTAGAACHIRMDGPSPQIEMVENDQVSPAGKFEIQVQGDRFYINGRNSGDTAYDTIAVFDRLGSSEIARASFAGPVVPFVDDGASLGRTTLKWSDLFLASGAVVNFNNGNATITHSTGLLTSSVDVAVPDEVYGAGWNGSLEVPTKNAIYDKIETLGAAGSQSVNTEAAGNATLVVGELSTGAGDILNIVESNAAGQTITLPAALVGDIGKSFQIYNKGTNRMTITSASTLNGDSVILAAKGGCVAFIEATGVYRLIGTGNQTQEIQIPVTDWTTALTVGDGKYYLRIPSKYNGWEITGVHAEVITAGTTGTTDVQIHNVTDAVDILSTKLTIDSTEQGSDTAATPAVINTSNNTLATEDRIRIDVDAISTTPPQGLIVSLTLQPK